MVRLRCDEFEILIEDVAYRVHPYRELAREFRILSCSDGMVASQHALTVFLDGEPVSSVVALAAGGASGVHEKSAIVLDQDVLLAVGPFIARFTLPSLDVIWCVEVDDATCFGVHYSPKHDLILSHGELEVSGWDPCGKLRWQTSGADIFTNGFLLEEDLIRVRDFENRDYVFSIATGASVDC